MSSPEDIDKAARMLRDGLSEGRKEGEKIKEALQPVLNDIFKKGTAAKDAFGISPSYLENIYAQAYRLYNSGKYSDASHLFRLLILFNSMEAKYVMGLAACYHMQKDYTNAIQTYTLCSLLDAKNPLPHYHTSDCYIQLKEYLSAMICIEMSIECAGDNPEFAKMKERALLGLEGLKQQVISHPLGEVSPETKAFYEKPTIF